VERARAPHAFREVQSAFERLWKVAKPLTAEWIDDYERRPGDAPRPAHGAVPHP
jgi:hypothetical protein